MYVTNEETSSRMRRIRSFHTAPEKIVRRILTEMGYRYRLHRRDLPGRPDIAFIARRKAIFVHGCFWHRHKKCPRSTMPRKNISLWKTKFRSNVKRDADNLAKLIKAGWDVLTLWECEIANRRQLADCLRSFLRNRPQKQSRR